MFLNKLKVLAVGLLVAANPIHGTGAPEGQPAAPVPVTPAQVARWLAGLDAEEFSTRESAAAALEKQGWAVEPALRKALEGKPSAEVRRRIGLLLDKLPRRDLVALEQKLYGEWKSDLDCVGDITIRADGTYERRGYSPGNNTLAGSWVMRWDALPPTLILTCKTSNDKSYVDTTEEVKLMQLNAETLAIKSQSQMNPVPYARVKK